MAYAFSKLWLFGQARPTIFHPSDDDPPSIEDLPITREERRDVIEINQNVDKVPKSEEGCTFPMFYAISLPASVIEDAHRVLVFTDKKEALNAVKKYDGARFKTFKNEQEAVAFASHSVEVSCATPKMEPPHTPPIAQDKNCSTNSEKPSQFKAPKSQDTVKLRKAIIAGDVNFFQDTVWNNPRYLVSSGDTPVILQEGFRYNALHVAAKHKQPELCRLILRTIENPAFMELLYEDDTETVRHQRIVYLTDLYLNMPDKRLCETPLHFASKFGCLETVRILASHPACDKARPNKYGLKAREIICERCPASSSEFKHQIDESFEAHFFVPVLRSSDNSVQPSIGKPCFKQDIDIPQTPGSGSPCGTVISVMAYAGPMSPDQASAFYKRLKTPPINISRAQFEEINRIRLCDTEKGLERCGRDLAQSMKTQWTEYWPSLNCWCDLSSSSGLDILERHLRNLYFKLSEKSCNASCGSEASMLAVGANCTNNESSEFAQSTPSSSGRSSNSSGINSLCKGLQKFHLHSPNSPEVICSSGTPFSWKFDPQSAGKLDCSVSNSQFRSNVMSPSSFAINYKCISPNGNDRPISNTPTGSERNFLKSVSDSPCNLKDTPRSKTRKLRISLNNSFTYRSCSQPKKDLFFAFTDNPLADCIKKLFSTEPTQKLQLSVKSLIECIVEMFMAMTLNSELCIGIKIHELTEDLHPEVLCLLRMSQMTDGDFSRVHSFIAQQVCSDLCDNFMEHEQGLVLRVMTSYLDHYIYLDTFEDNETLRGKIMWQHLKCIFKYICAFLQNGIQELYPCDCPWTIECIANKKFNAWGDSNGYRYKYPCPTNCDSQDEDSEKFCTPPSSPLGEYASSDEEAVTPNEGLEVFVEGSYPSKADVDILRAIEKVQLDSVQYPHITRWKHLISSKDKTVIDSWPSPAVNRCRWKNVAGGSFIQSPISPLAMDYTSPRAHKKTTPFLERLEAAKD